MTTQTYAGTAGRINIVKGEMLAISEPQEVLTLGVSYKKFPKNQGDNVKYRARIPTGGATTNTSTINRWSVTASSYVTSEGVTPAARTVAYRDVSAQLVQYAVLYSYSDKAADLHEDDIPEDQKLQCAQEMGLVREMVRYGEMKAATNVQYSGGTTRATVDEPITYNQLSLMARTLLANGGMYKTRILAPGPEYDTSAIEASFIVFCHTDCRHDVRLLQDFVPLAKYANRKPIHPNEFGSLGEFRFVSSKELAPYASAGASVGSTGLVSAANDNVDVYPFIVCGENAVFDIALNLNFSVHHIPVSQESKDDPLAQRGYVGTKWYQVTKAVNGGWFGCIEAGVTALAST
jgi:N4-gp56 family major capsid protein